MSIPMIDADLCCIKILHVSDNKSLLGGSQNLPTSLDVIKAIGKIRLHRTCILPNVTSPGNSCPTL